MPRTLLTRLALALALFGPAAVAGCADRDEGGGSGPGSVRSEAANPATTPSGHEGQHAGQTSAGAK